MISVYTGPKGDAVGLVGAVAAGAVPLVVGTIALGAAALVAVIEERAYNHLVMSERRLELLLE